MEKGSTITGHHPEAIVTDVKVSYVFKFPNGMVVAFGDDEKQIPNLQGKYTPELHEKIKQFSTEQTQWKGFE